jgi:hypothetical protein
MQSSFYVGIAMTSRLCDASRYTSTRPVAKLLRCSWIPLAALIACSSPSTPTPGDQAEELARNQRQFQSLVGGNYRVTYENSCFCPVETLRPVRLTVVNGALSDVTRVSDGASLPPSDWRSYRTVDQVFAEIEAGLNRGAQRVVVTYDSQYGYPRDVLVDYQMAADAFVGFKLSNLETVGRR